MLISCILCPPNMAGLQNQFTTNLLNMILYQVLQDIYMMLIRYYKLYYDICKHINDL